MAVALSIFGIAFAAFSVWLGVRAYNRPEQWAKWTLACAVGLPVLYVASFGPACWIADRELLSEYTVEFVYRPAVSLCITSGSQRLRDALLWYRRLIPNPQRKWSTAEDVLRAALLRRPL